MSHSHPVSSTLLTPRAQLAICKVWIVNMLLTTPQSSYKSQERFFFFSSEILEFCQLLDAKKEQERKSVEITERHALKLLLQLLAVN